MCKKTTLRVSMGIIMVDTLNVDVTRGIRR